ncbi:MarR family winged helix-turn-helix transcriptional regulator [Cellulomonas sp. HZM]|uniref:MarR family winged helix-turn-helix transcriptional regulator n=1 Tax=Cellulomonas sp. HZM TaxID=1454010 RepID=UPI0004930254|nr:MarR family transcriptional regulator [Cellulomonas sp. HZM]
MPTTTAADTATQVRVVFGRLRRRMREVAQADDLSASQLAVLIRLGKGEVGTASTFAAAEGVRPQSMAATIAVLDERGFVTRVADPDDGRRQLVVLTDAGRERAAGDREARAEWLATRLAALPDEDVATIQRAMDLLDEATAR